MKAAVWYGKEDIRIEECEVPSVKPGMVKIKVAWAGICGSDLHAYHGYNVQVDVPHPVTGQMAPLALGHEFSGIVEEVGEGVTNIEIGERVAVEPSIRCGKCHSCKLGNYNICDSFGFLGLNGEGAFAEYILVNDFMVHKLPESVSLEVGAMIEPTAVAFHAVKQSKMKVGDDVAVFGVGPIGLLTIISAKAAGAAQIIAVDVSPERLAKAAEVGATTIINAAEENAVQTILAATGGVAVAFEAAGAAATVNNALAAIRKKGEVVIISIINRPIEIDVLQLTGKEANLTSTLGYRNVFPEVIALIAGGKMDIKPVMTKQIVLDDIIEEGFKALMTDKTQAKILVNTQA
ncbi:2,3-butanediol dehydrogenase [Paenibacillus sp. strain BS8-2]